MTHQFMSADHGVSCLTCGAEYADPSTAERCSGRTDLTHGYDVSSHSLDGCAAFDDTGDCDHLAIGHGCDCLACT